MSVPMTALMSDDDERCGRASAASAASVCRLVTAAMKASSPPATDVEHDARRRAGGR